MEQSQLMIELNNFGTVRMIEFVGKYDLVSIAFKSPQYATNQQADDDTSSVYFFQVVDKLYLSYDVSSRWLIEVLIASLHELPAVFNLSIDHDLEAAHIFEAIDPVNMKLTVLLNSYVDDTLVDILVDTLKVKSQELNEGVIDGDECFLGQKYILLADDFLLKVCQNFEKFVEKVLAFDFFNRQTGSKQFIIVSERECC
jgi:hypothetical protein